jgi:hypothetical protein
LAVGLVSTGIQWAARPARVAAAFASDSTAAAPRFLSAGEVELAARLDGELDPAGAVLGDPFNGSAHLYALTGQPVVFPHLTGRWDADRLYVMEHLDRLDEDPEVCAALGRLGARYLYTDPVRYYDYAEYPGLARAETAGLRLVDSGGGASVYELTPCR